MKTVDYFISVMSPWTFLGSKRFEELAAEKGAAINIMPMNTGHLFTNSGGLPVAKRHPLRQKYRLEELARWRDHLCPEMNIQPTHFPANDQIGAAMVLSAKEQGLDAVRLAHQIMEALWIRDLNISDPETLIGLADEAGLDGKALYEASQSPAIAEGLMKNAELALETGVFGMPWYHVEGQNFWGQDRLEFLARALD